MKSTLGTPKVRTSISEVLVSAISFQFTIDPGTGTLQKTLAIQVSDVYNPGTGRISDLNRSTTIIKQNTDFDLFTSSFISDMISEVETELKAQGIIGASDTLSL